MSNEPFLSLLLASIGTFALLIYGSRFLIDTFNLFPEDTEDPLSFKNTLHHAWGSSSSSKHAFFPSKMNKESMDDALAGLKDNMVPIGLAVLLGFSAAVAFFVFGKSKSESDESSEVKEVADA